MSIESINVKISGIQPLLMSNPQTVDRFNPFAKEIAKINAKKTRRTDEDYRHLADLEVRSKVHWSDDHGVFVPSTWLLAALCKNGFNLKKLAKDKIRGSVFTTAPKIKLNYEGQDVVQTLDDVVGNPRFRYQMNVKQGQVRIMKSMPIFKDWSFETELEFENTQIDPSDLKALLEYSAKYGGFGDFRPTFGRSVAEVTI
jgi:hypothetical protein